MHTLQKPFSTSKALMVPVIFLVGLLLLSVTLWLALRHLENSRGEASQYYFREIVTRTAATVRAQLLATMHPLQEAAAKISQRWPMEDRDILHLLDTHPLMGKFKQAGVFFREGGAIATTGGVGSARDHSNGGNSGNGGHGGHDVGRAGSPFAPRLPARDESLFAGVGNGRGKITETLVDSEDGLPINVFQVPVLYQDKVVAVVFASMDSTALTPLLEAPLFNKVGGSFVMNRQGLGVSLGFAHSLNKNSLLDGLNKTSGVTPPLDDIRAQLEKGLAGSARFTHRGAEFYVAFAPLDINNWFAVGFMPATAGNEPVQAAARWLMMVLAAGGVLFLALLAYVLWLVYCLRRQERKHQFRMDTLANCFPGAIVRCRDDATWTLMEYNQGLLNMLGFTEEEVRETFHNQFLPLIYGPDRASVLEMTTAARSEVTNDDRPRPEYRLERKDGTQIWVTEHSKLVYENNDTHWCMVLLDITARRNALERRLVEAKRYRILFEISEAILYEYDMRSGILTTTRQFFDKFVYPMPDTMNSLHPISMDVFHPEDVETFASLHQTLLDGEPAAEALVRIMRGNGQWLWCHMQQTALRDSQHRCIKALGRITDVDAETRVLYQLREEMQRDPFTGLYNKVATAAQVDEALAQLEDEAKQCSMGASTTPDAEAADPADPAHADADAAAAAPDAGQPSQSALCIVDVDNFKNVNDTLGHDKGDQVLKSLTESLLHISRQTDIVGRVGGDEFIIFFKHVKSMQSLCNSLERLLESMHRTIPCPGGEDFELSASVGVALFPQNGTRFGLLYPRADKALYRSKKRKNAYSFYDAELDGN